MDNFSIKALDSNQLFISKYRLIPKISYLTLLYYQFVFVKETNIKDEIICSNFEDGYHLPFITITRYNKEKRQYILKRIPFNEEIYKSIQDIFPNDDKDIVINENLLKTFNELYSKTHDICALLEQK